MVSEGPSETLLQNVEYVKYIGMMIWNEVGFTRDWFICKAYVRIY